MKFMNLIQIRLSSTQLTAIDAMAASRELTDAEMASVVAGHMVPPQDSMPGLNLVGKGFGGLGAGG